MNTGITFTIKTKDPEGIVRTIRDEVARRKSEVERKMPGALTQRESRLLGREAYTYESILWMLDRVKIES